jgi:tripeptide aminopeptidase
MSPMTSDSQMSRVVSTFLDAVRIDSPSGEEAAFGAWCVDRLGELGCEVRVDGTGPASGSDYGNVIAEFPGTAAGKVVVFCAHLDTVQPGRGIVPVIEDGVIRSSGATILASDDKAGIASILETLARVRERGLVTPPVRVLLTTGEEMGLQGAKAIDPADCTGDICLVPDAHGPVGGIVGAAPTQYTFRAEFTGVSSHAGVEPEKGRSALVMAANAIAAMRLGRLDALTTANVGEIHGGTATNVVTASTTIRGECRSLDRAEAEVVRAEMGAAMRAAALEGGGSVDIDWKLEYEGFRFAPGDPVLNLLLDACSDLGIPSDVFDTGGGSDANVLTAKGLPSVCLGCGMTAVHGTEESIAISDLELMTELMIAVLLRAVAA